MYLRERPHDVPDQEKFVWWIPVVMIRQNNLDFTTFKPSVWMKREKEITMTGLPGKDEFIIVNPEEIGTYSAITRIKLASTTIYKYVSISHRSIPS